MRLGEINPTILGIAVYVWIMGRSRPKPPERVMVKPKLGRRNPCKINPPKCFMIDPGEMFVPEISEPIFFFPRWGIRIDNLGILPD